MSSDPCPNPFDLISFVVGQIDDPILKQKISDHLEHCPSCQKAVDSLNSVIDPNVFKLKPKIDTSKRIDYDDEIKSVLKKFRHNFGERNLSLSVQEIELSGSNSLNVESRSTRKFVSPERREDWSIHDFELVEKLGSGGTGTVFRAHQVSNSREVALKTFHEQNFIDINAATSRFSREAHAIANLDHPSIPEIYGAWQQSGQCYIAMEYVEGVTFKQFLKFIANLENVPSSFDRALIQCAVSCEIERTVFYDSTDDFPPVQNTVGNSSASVREFKHQYPLTDAARTYLASDDYIQNICRMVCEIAKVLHYAHGKRVVHRDIKPSNLMIAGKRIYVIDFGLSKFDEDISITMFGQLLGTPMYMSPEQITLPGQVDFRTDIYSLGLTMYQLLAAVPPMQAESPEAILQTVVTKPLVPLGWLNSGVTRDLESIIHKATSKDPDARYSNAMEFATDLRCFLDRKPVNAEIYQYRFSTYEIFAKRPFQVFATSLWFFYVAMFYGIILFPLNAGSLIRRSGTGEQFAATLLQFLLPALIGGLVGWCLLRGSRVARWVGLLATSYLAFDSFQYIYLMLKVSLYSNTLTTLLQFGHIFLGRIPILVGASVAAYVLLFDASSSAWFRFARKAFHQYRSEINRHRTKQSRFEPEDSNSV